MSRIGRQDQSSTPDDGRQEYQRPHRHIHIPAYITEFVMASEINRGEAYLLGLVDSLVKSRGLGCYATNAHLGSLCDVSNRQVQRELAKLTEMGLIVSSERRYVSEYTGEEMRTLETAWSRLPVRDPGTLHRRK